MISIVVSRSLLAGDGQQSFKNGTASYIYSTGSNPGSSSYSATLQQHLPTARGSVSWDIFSDVNVIQSGKTSSFAYSTFLQIHGVVFSIIFLLLIPVGVLFARTRKLIGSNWFPAHWVMNGVVSGSLVVIGFVTVTL